MMSASYYWILPDKSFLKRIQNILLFPINKPIIEKKMESKAMDALADQSQREFASKYILAVK